MNRRWFLGSSACAVGMAAAFDLPAQTPADGLRIGLTAVVVREYARFFRDFRVYLSLRTGRAVSFVQRKTYAEIMDLLAQNEIQAAWICGFPFVQNRDPEFLELLVAPLYQGVPLYRSYLIVPRDSRATRLDDLKGTVFAYSDPDSNSGYLVPRAQLLAAGHDPDTFFRLTFFTYNHAETVAAVAAGMADGGAVDSYVYNMVRRHDPETAAATRVIAESRQYGFPPIVVRRDLADDTAARLQEALVGMARDPDGRALLQRLGLDGFQVVSPALYQPIRALWQRTLKASQRENAL